MSTTAAARRARQIRDEVRPHVVPIASIAGVTVAWAVWVTGSTWVTPAFAIAALAGATLGVIDARTQRLPNAIVHPAFAAVLVLLGIAAAGTAKWESLARAALSGLALSLVYLTINLIDPSGRGLGLGDVKLAAILGLLAGWVSWQATAWTGVLPFLLGAVAAVAMIATGRGGRGRTLAFGPYMLIGAVVALTLAIR
ncbi:prepilin peptidase [Xylanimonas ulmi]|uniref:Leader peptidase (Prepilin peptidase)/N-methyltransferase n=1 Tax=Xylanimonas ulmi TaxID=228973 RepID=A0A4Q7M4B0_9MICO|nr:A24 family peptidase [Xylanibacterium ulmi]RZS62201.1 leader peptidase (prepilin peptidase)/N-methyltransferase [Xylanibacterium ulmi]